MRVSIVLPAYNEEPNIARAIAEVSEVAGRLFADHEIVVVDDGSTDDTARVAAEAAAADDRVRLVRHDINRGYGGALRTGFSSTRLDHVFLTDADLQFDMRELERLLPHAEKADVVAGYRLNRQDPPGRRIVAHAWNTLVRALFDISLRDVNCAFKLFDGEKLRSVELESEGAMVSTELMVKLTRRGATVVEVGVHHRPRVAGKAGGASRRVVATAFRELFRMRRRLNRVGP